MKLTRHEYLNREEKVKDFTLGVVILIAVNTLLILALLLVTRIGNQNNLSGNKLFTFVSTILSCLPLAVNIGLLAYFGSTRSWIAMGMLGVIGLIITLVILAGVIFMVYCFISL